MRTIRLTILLLILIATLGGTVSAQDDEGAARVEIVEIVADELPQVTLLVNVFDAFQVPVPGLTANDFAVTVGGEPATITDIQNITRDELPISVVLVIDSSESMLGLPLLSAQDAARAFLERLRPGDRSGLGGLARPGRGGRDLSWAFEACRAPLADLQGVGGTGFFQAGLGEMGGGPGRAGW